MCEVGHVTHGDRHIGEGDAKLTLSLGVGILRAVDILGELEDQASGRKEPKGCESQ